MGVAFDVLLTTRPLTILMPPPPPAAPPLAGGAGFALGVPRAAVGFGCGVDFAVEGVADRPPVRPPPPLPIPVAPPPPREPARRAPSGVPLGMLLHPLTHELATIDVIHQLETRAPSNKTGASSCTRAVASCFYGRSLRATGHGYLFRETTQR